MGAGQLPVGGHEILSPAERHTEDVLLAVRLNTGIALADLTVEERGRVPAVVSGGLARLVDDRLVLTDQGRLLADGVVRTILD